MRHLLLSWLLVAVSAPVFSQASYSPYANQNFPREVHWGDMHLHTNLSIDANGFGNQVLSPDDAYRFARGEEVTAHNGMKVRLRRPLDFLVVADHGENLGVALHLQAENPALLETETGKRWRKVMREHPIEARKLLAADTWRPLVDAMNSIYTGARNRGFGGGAGLGYGPEVLGHIGDETFRRSVWAKVADTAERHNKPGKFSAFIGYEWSSAGREPRDYAKFANLHRVVVFRDGPDKTNQVLPFTALDSTNPEDLWAYLAQYQRKTGGEVLAIPHNGNLSNGEMFSLLDFQGRALNHSYAQTRGRWEPLYEVTQIKGDSEAHPMLSPADEFADFETWPPGSGRRDEEGISAEGLQRKAAEYARSALKLGLDQHAKLGINPFKFGVIGSTDAHTSLSAVAENNFWGKFALLEPSEHRITFGEISNPAKKYIYSNAAGYAAIWATENTREALFAAMKRKEAYATTGTRITVRFFGGWRFEPNDALKPDLALIGYTKGVPMGGDLTHAPEGGAPSFLIRAVKDADGANLDRLQVIKGWRSADGKLHEKIYNVALSDGRVVGDGGKVPPVGNTVDIKNVSYSNSIGDPELTVVWSDPDFNAAELAFYYLRVLEIPTPRWTAYDAKFFGLKDISDEVPMVTQERAYSSPIWYTPFP